MALSNVLRVLAADRLDANPAGRRIYAAPRTCRILNSPFPHP
jgi:hypothetical protein